MHLFFNSYPWKDAVISTRLQYSASIFTAEVWAIKDSVVSKYIIFTDSLLCLQALEYMKLEYPLIGMVIRKCVFFNFANKDITFCRVPGLVGIRGNEKADTAAKSAFDLPRVKVGVPNTDFKPIYSFHLAVVNKLHYIKPVMGDWQSSYRQCRKDEVVLCRARIGHTHLTHSHIFRKDLSVSTVSVFSHFGGVQSFC